MNEKDARDERKPYVPPAITRVSVDPVKEMLQGTCLFDPTLCAGTTPRQ